MLKIVIGCYLANKILSFFEDFVAGSWRSSAMAENKYVQHNVQFSVLTGATSVTQPTLHRGSATAFGRNLKWTKELKLANDRRFLCK